MIVIKLKGRRRENNEESICISNLGDFDFIGL
jgi:hypothetical protein